MAAILAFRSARTKQNWTNDELAELYRVVDILGRAGLQVDTEAGLSDEGDPWFLFCRADTGDVIAHFARIDGQFIAASAAIDETFRGASFRQIIDQMVDRQPLMLPRPAKGEKLFLHPAVVLTAFVATALQQMQNWDAEEVGSPVEARIGPDAHKPVEKSALMEALSAAFRGGPPSPADDKNSHSEFAAASIQGLSLASVVAFAMSVVQGWQNDAEAGPTREPDRAQKIETKVADAAQSPMVEVGSQTATGKHDAVPTVSESREQQARDGTVGERAAEDLASNDNEAGGQAHATAPATADNLAQKTMQVVTTDDLWFQPLADYFPATAATEAPVATTDKAAPPVRDIAKIEFPSIKLGDISTEALEIFFFKLPAHRSPTANDAPALNIPSAGDRVAVGPATGPVPDDQPAGRLRVSDIVFGGGDKTVAPLLSQITDFVYAPENWIGAPALSAGLATTLGKYAVANKPLTLVVFDSSDVALDIFSFTPGVMFVEEDRLPATMDFADQPAMIELANGGSITLMGVMTIDHALV